MTKAKRVLDDEISQEKRDVLLSYGWSVEEIEAAQERSYEDVYSFSVDLSDCDTWSELTDDDRWFLIEGICPPMHRWDLTVSDDRLVYDYVANEKPTARWHDPYQRVKRAESFKELDDRAVDDFVDSRTSLSRVDIWIFMDYYNNIDSRSDVKNVPDDSPDTIDDEDKCPYF
jgi:hypothetical protein